MKTYVTQATTTAALWWVAWTLLYATFWIIERLMGNRQQEET